jgi:hypothetical protein
LVEVDSQVVQVPSPENEYSATVKVRAIFHDSVFCGVADASPRNMDASVSAHSVANAETRAEARAYRKALGLNIIAAEELVAGQTGKEFVPRPEPEDGNKIVDNQISFMSILAERNDVNVEKLVVKMFPNTHNIYSLTYEEGAKVNGVIQQAGRTDELEVEGDTEEDPTTTIDKECVKGYDKDWQKSEFGEKK